MSKNTNRKGLALGAMFSLVASLFGSAPASANVSTTAFTFAPAAGSSYNVYVDHDFHLVVQRNTAVVSATDMAQLKYEITDTRGFGPSASSFSLRVLAGTYSGTVTDMPSDASVRVSSSAGVEAETTTWAQQRIFYQGRGYHASTTSIPAYVETGSAPTGSYVVKPNSVSATTTNFIALQLGFAGAGQYANSRSPGVTVTVRAFIDLNGDNVFQSSTEPSATQNVSFIPYASATPAVAINAYGQSDTSVQASVTLAGSSVNLNQTSGKWGVRFQQWIEGGKVSTVSYSATAERSLTFADGASLSFTESVTITSARAGHSISAEAIFFRDNTAFGGGAALAFTTGGVENALVAASQSSVIMWHAGATSTTVTAGASGASFYAVKGTNALGTATSDEAGEIGRADVRVGTARAYTVRLTTSGAVDGATVTFTFSNPVLSGFKTYSVDGGTAITSGTWSAVTKTLTAGTASVELAIVATGFSAADHLTISAKVNGLAGAAYVLTLYSVNPTYSIAVDASQLAIAPAGTANVGVTVTDQFGVNSSAVDQRIRFAWASGYSGTATRSDVALVNGRATAAMVHSPATSTVSATITATLQESSGGVFSDVSGVNTRTVNVTVTSAANGFRTGLARSYSATISYGAAFSWSPVINDVYVVITGSQVVVSGTGLIFKDDVLGLTASDTITLPGDSAARVKFYVTARKAGTYTLTLTAGTATTTSLIVVADAQDNAGRAIDFDISSMESGRAAIVTGTLTDLNGNPVDTTLGGATIALNVSGTGATFVGALTAESNANGKFQVALLSGTNQTGTITITAVYSPTSGAAAADKVTKVHTVSVVAPTAPEVNAVIGSFNGRWAVRVENAKGSVVSVKAGNRWVKFSALNNNYLFSLKSVVGRTIAVSVWVDGELQNSQTITIK